MDKDLTIKLYQIIADSNEDREYEAWHCSSIAECPRAHYFKRLGIKRLNKPSSALVLRWDAGHAFEAAIRKHVSKLFPDLRSNERFYSKLMDLTGEFDNLSGVTLIEIKTVHDYAFIQRDNQTYLKEADGQNARGQNAWKAKERPYLHHEMQNHCYAKLLKEKENIDVENIVYIYISLSGRLVVYNTTPDPDIFKLVEKRLEILNEAWRTKTPPECICDQYNHPLYGPVMQYCDYRTEEGCCSLDLLKEVGSEMPAVRH